MVSRRARRILAIGLGAGLALASVGAAWAGSQGRGAPVVTETFMPTRGQAASHGKPPAKNLQLSFHGANPGVVKGRSLVYLVFWGSQWANGANDPSGEATILTNFFSKIGQSSWNNSVTQYCDSVAVGTVTCGTSGQHASNPAIVLGGSWFDGATAAPASPADADFWAEAGRAAARFGNTTAASNQTVQYVIATATGNNQAGFGSSFCAWHGWANSGSGKLAFTNLPYITDAGPACGADFNALGPNAGITIVGGHEYAETETDIFPTGGWLDSRGAENGDKCSWISAGQGASAMISTVDGTQFPVQSLWSNAFSGNSGGCVLSYP